MTGTYQKQPQGPVFNYETHVRELNERFGRLIKQLGTNNKAGTYRHEYEVDFSYALHDVKTSPAYMQGKKFDQASAVVTSLINHLKRIQEEKA